MSLDGSGDVLDSGNFGTELVKRCPPQLQCRGWSDGSPNSCLGGLVESCVSQAVYRPALELLGIPMAALFCCSWFVCLFVLTWTCFCVPESIALEENVLVKADSA